MQLTTDHRLLTIFRRSAFAFELRYRYRRLKEKLITKIAWTLPRTLVMWCAIRLMAHATTGQWGNECPNDVDFFTALKRWDIRHTADCRCDFREPIEGATL